MSLYGTLKIEDVDIEENESLLQSINSKNNNLLLEFSFPLCDIRDMFKYYVNRKIEDIDDLDIYDCIDIEINKEDNEYIFDMNPSDDEEDQTDIKFIDCELKKIFGVSVLRSKLTNVLRLLLMDCKGYAIENDMLTINIYYDNFKHTWIKEYLEQINE